MYLVSHRLLTQPPSARCASPAVLHRHQLVKPRKPAMAAAGKMEISRIECGARLSEAVVLKGNAGIVHLAGQVPEDTSKDIKGQTEECLKCIDALLAQAGTSKENILSATIYLTEISNFPGMNEAWDAWVPKGAAPARATIGGVKLADPGWLVEILITAAVPVSS